MKSLLGSVGLEVRKKTASRIIRMPLQREAATPAETQGAGARRATARPARLPGLKKFVKRALSATGLEVVRLSSEVEWRAPVELSGQERDVVAYVKQNALSSTSYERLWATAMACKHVAENSIPGDFVECGVMRGGHAIVAAAILKLNGSGRRIYLFDTFAGMTAPTEKDREAVSGNPAQATFDENQRGSHNDWCYASLADVRANFQSAGLLGENIVFVQGDVARTLDVPSNLPESIAVLRLDTDWYESTKKELEVLYPRLSTGGVLLIDDYGHWAGAREAVDEYFRDGRKRPFFVYNDNTGRAGVKVAK